MDLPGWVLQSIREYKGPETETGEVEVVLTIESYKRTVTKLKIGGRVTIKPPQQ